MPKKLSVCIATFNEEANIKKCLDAVINWVDEIVIVDGFSTDNTVKEVRNFGSKVRLYQYPNPANFLINRGRAMDKARGEWLLVLDADEVVSKRLSEEILKALSSSANDAYWLPRLNYFLGSPLRKGGQYPDYCLRLVKKELSYQPTKNLHNQVAVKTKKNRISYLKEPLKHYPYPQFEVYLRKWVQYSSHEADLLTKKGVKPSLVLFLKYFFIYPKIWFLKTYFRHKGFRDGFAGFVFALFSSLRYLVIYIKLYEQQK
jgi:(heptosyl)LPS beta-1,4-glucosyltransferase